MIVHRRKQDNACKRAHIYGELKGESQFMESFRPTSNKKALGERSQVFIIFKLLEHGYHVLTPYGDNTRYDLVIEDADGTFWRVQCKTGWLESNGAYIEFKAASSYYHRRREGRDTGEKIIEGRSNSLPFTRLIQVKCILSL